MVLLLALNLPLAPPWAKLLRIPRPYLYAGILFFAAVGAYAVGGEVTDPVIPLIITVQLAWPLPKRLVTRDRPPAETQ